MKRQPVLLGAALLLCLAFGVPTQDTRQDDAKRIDALERALEAQRKKTFEVQARVERIEAWFAMVRNASELLDTSVNDARKNGFESAGPNPLSRTQLLDGMKGFAAELTRNVPGPAPALPAEPR